MSHRDVVDFILLSAGWGAVFLPETVTLRMVLGGAVVLAGMALTLG